MSKQTTFKAVQYNEAAVAKLQAEKSALQAQIDQHVLTISRLGSYLNNITGNAKILTWCDTHKVKVYDRDKQRGAYVIATDAESAINKHNAENPVVRRSGGIGIDSADINALANTIGQSAKYKSDYVTKFAAMRKLYETNPRYSVSRDTGKKTKIVVKGFTSLKATDKVSLLLSVIEPDMINDDLTLAPDVKPEVAYKRIQDAIASRKAALASMAL